MSSGKKVLIALNVLVVVVLAGSTGYLFMKNRDLNDQLTLTTEEKNKRLVDEINAVFDLPDEDPVVAIVTNPDEFKAEYPVFDNAQSGDYLLFFRKARLNVLYRQDEKRVVKTADVVVPIAIEVIGSEAAVNAVAEKLQEFGNQISVTKTVLDGVTQSFVFDTDSDQGAEAESVAKQLGIDVGSTLPSTITPSQQTEIVVVVDDKQASAPKSSSAEEAEPSAEQEP